MNGKTRGETFGAPFMLCIHMGRIRGFFFQQEGMWVNYKWPPYRNILRFWPLHLTALPAPSRVSLLALHFLRPQHVCQPHMPESYLCHSDAHLKGLGPQQSRKDGRIIAQHRAPPWQTLQTLQGRIKIKEVKSLVFCCLIACLSWETSSLV